MSAIKGKHCGIINSYTCPVDDPTLFYYICPGNKLFKNAYVRKSSNWRNRL